MRICRQTERFGVPDSAGAAPQFGSAVDSLEFQVYSAFDRLKAGRQTNIALQPRQRASGSRRVFVFAFLSLLSLILAGRPVHAQETGAVSGIVVGSWDGTPLAGVVVTARGTTLAARTDAQGRYELKNVPVGDQVLRFSKSGFASAVVADVRVLPGQTTTVNGNLRPEFYDLEEYEVTAEEFTTQTEKILFERQQSSALLDAIGSEQFSRTGASDAADIVGKVAGITISDNKNPVVRGLNERYVGMQLNGAEVPSPDPYHKSAPLDLFPSAVIDRIIVNKSFTPDQPGNFTGGGINIVTKSFPEKFFFNMSVGGSYNTQSTLNERFLTYPGGSLDWVGMDDGTRALPSALASPSLQVPNPPFSSGLPSSATYNQRLADAAVLQDLTRAIGPTQFAPSREAPPFNHNFSFSSGDSTKILGKPFGLFYGVSYDHKYSFYENGVSRRYVVGSNGSELRVRKDYSDTKAASDVNWAGTVNLAYQPFEHHEVNFNFLYNQNAEDLARQQVGTSSDDPGYLFHQNRLHFTERNLNTFQLKGRHEFPTLAGTKLDWLAALSLTSQDEPDTRFFNYLEDGGRFQTGSSALPNPDLPTRYFRALDEENRNYKVDLTQPFHQWSGLEGQIKAGFFSSSSQREFLDREVYYPGTITFDGDPNSYLTDDNLGFSAVTNSQRRITYAWSRYIQTRDSIYSASQDVPAGYGMLDVPLLESVRLIGGVRMESTELNIKSRSYIANSSTGSGNNDTSLEESSLLPAAGLVWTVISNMNVRASFSQTIARPSFRELAAYRSYDPVLDELLEGNPTLKLTHVENYDLRWEWFRRPGEVLAVSLFYKDLENAIEKAQINVEGDIITFRNRPQAKVYGVEFEARQPLDFIHPDLHVFTAGFNFSLIESEAPLTPAELKVKTSLLPGTKPIRTLYDQSPYTLNADLTFDSQKSGTTASVIFSVYGPRITIVNLNTPDTYERSAPQLDFILSQKLSSHFKIKFSAKNLLDPRFDRTYGEDGKELYSSYTRGRSFGLSVTYDY